MGTLLAILAIVFVLWIISKASGSKSSRSSEESRPHRSAPGHSPGPSAPQSRPPPPKKDNVYKPKAGSGNTSVTFRNTDQPVPSSTKAAPEAAPIYADLSGLHDAFTGAPLNPQLGLYRCGKCSVFYHAESYEILKQENSSKCVACSSPSIQSVTEKSARSEHGRDHRPDVVTLSNYKSSVGRVVTFQGVVRDVKASKNGTDYAVMFEQASWTKGFKLIFFRKSIQRVGGASFINSFKGKTITVRGLVVSHPVFGYQIIVSERSMILSII
jgi:hypothetical protein